MLDQQEYQDVLNLDRLGHGQQRRPLPRAEVWPGRPDKCGGFRQLTHGRLPDPRGSRDVGNRRAKEPREPLGVLAEVASGQAKGQSSPGAPHLGMGSDESGEFLEGGLRVREDRPEIDEASLSASQGPCRRGLSGDVGKRRDAQVARGCGEPYGPLISSQQPGQPPGSRGHGEGGLASHGRLP